MTSAAAGAASRMKVRFPAGRTTPGGDGTAVRGGGAAWERGGATSGVWGRLEGPPGGARLPEVIPTGAVEGEALRTFYPYSYAEKGLKKLLSEL